MVVTLILTMTTTQGSIANPSGAYVDIINSVNDSVLVHCQSKDSDIGARPVDTGTDYSFQFHPNIFGMTLYWCEFFWKTKTQNFQVWKGSYYDDRPPCSVKGPCNYKIATDGFYYALDAENQDATSWEFYKQWLPVTPLM